MNIAVVGTGLVGSCFLKQLNAVASKHDISVVLVARSNSTTVSKDYSPLSLEREFPATTSEKWSFLEIAQFLEKSPKPSVLVDNTSSEDLAQAYPEFVKRGISIVTPNKKAFSSSLELWNTVFDSKSKALIYHEATVGAGLPVIGTLKDLIACGDKVKTISGVFSGSMSFIFNEFCASDSIKFSDVVKKAQQLGYTEPDPREDLNGMDVARKVTILARLSGKLVEDATAFPVQSLIPDALRSLSSGEEFLEKLPEYDAEMSKLREEAKKEGKVLRYVGTVDLTGASDSVSVGIQKIDASAPMANLKGADNLISFVTERYPIPLIVMGAGAGDAVTAMGILSDLIKVSERLKSSSSN